MGEEEKFEAIVIGAGPAGIACAYKLAQEGKSVLVIERGERPGSKNVTGGRLYTYALELLDPGLWSEAALERKVTHEKTIILNGSNALNIEYHNPSFNQEGQMPVSYTILRGSFDEWFAGKAEEMGALVACGIKVDGLIEQNGQVVGVRCGEDEMLADVVVAADGVNSVIARQAGLISDIAASTVGVGVKEIIELPAPVIEERFHLQGDEGTACMLLGCTEGIHGGGFLYTNQQSISLGCVFTPEEAARNGRQIHDIFQELKMHPAINPLLTGGQTVEYSAHLVSEMGYRGIPQNIFKSGLLLAGDAAGLVINTGYSIRGIDLAIVSGLAAALAILQVNRAEEVGPAYRKELQRLVIPAMQAADGFVNLLEIPRIYSDYPAFILDMCEQAYRIDAGEPKNLKKAMASALKRNDLSAWKLIKDGLRGYRAI